MDDLDFLRQGNTIFDILDRQFPFLQENYSTQNLAEGMLKFYKITGSPSGKISNTNTKAYEEIYRELYIAAVRAIKRAYNELDKSPEKREYNPISERDLRELLSSIYSINGYNNLIPAFSSLEEYLDFTLEEENITNPMYEDLRRKIFSVGIRGLDEDYLNKRRKEMLHTAYIPTAREILKRKIEADKKMGSSEVQKEHEEELSKLDIVKRIVGNDDRLFTYESILDTIKEKGKEFEGREIESIILLYRRGRTVQKRLLEAAPGKIEEKGKLEIDKTFFGHTELPYTPKTEGAYRWNIEKHKMPVLILNETAKYSENGEADQKVIAVSYGRFKYNYLIHKDTNEASGSGSFMEVVGVSRIGKDGRKDYYVLVPFYPDVSLEGKDTENFDFYQWLEEIKDKENQKPVTFSEFGFMDETYAIALDKIPEGLREFYAQAFFSDAYLREVVSKNYRVTGSVTCSEGVPKINASDKSEPGMIIDLEAARYAGKHDAEDLSFFKLDSEASFIEFYRYQDGIVRAILDKEKEESKLESKASPKVEQNDGKPNEIEELGEI